MLRSALRAVTGWGWALVAFAVLGAAAAVVSGWMELAFMSAAAAMLLVTAVPWIIRGRSVRIRLRLSADRVAVGAPAFAALEVSRSGRLSMPNSVEVVLGSETVVVALPRLARGHESVIRIPLETTRRGRLAVGPVRIAHTDPLGILERLTELSESHTLIVHPRTVRVPAASSGLVKDLEGEAAKDLSLDDVAFHSLREYQPGDDRRLVHWRTSARYGSLLVRQFEPSRRSDTVICVTTAPEEVGTANFELALSAAATLGIAAMLERRHLRVLSGSSASPGSVTEIDSRSRDRLLDELTDLQRDGRAGIVDTVASLPRRQEAAIAWIIVGAETSARVLRELLARVPVDVEPIIIRADDGASPGISRLANTPVLTIGVLEDLIREVGHGAQA